jgi:hypothetical protein
MLGTSERADLSGHLFGLAAGIVVGVPCVPFAAARPGPLAQWSLGLGAGALLFTSWGAALR